MAAPIAPNFESLYVSNAPMETWQITNALRWNGGILEQAWQCLQNGNLKWEPVPSKGPFEP